MTSVLTGLAPRPDGTAPPERAIHLSSAERHADDLIAELAAMPKSDPRRAALRDRTIEAWLSWSYQYVRRYSSGSRSVEDLRQVAALALIKAVDGYDPRRGDRFAPYATVTIRGELKRHFRDHSWGVRVPRRLQELVLAIAPTTERLRQELWREPTTVELASALDVPDSDILEAFDATGYHHLISLQSPSRATPDAADEVGDSIGQPDPRVESAADRLALSHYFARLSSRDRSLLTLRFYGNKSQYEIATELGISQMHVSRLLNTALTRLRIALTATD